MCRRLATMSAVLTVFLAMLVSCGTYYEGKSVSVKSPDGSIEAVFELKDMPPPYHLGENMYFTVSWNGKQLLKESPLGLTFSNNTSVMGNLVITTVAQTSGSDEFSTPLGKKAAVSAGYNELTVSLREKTIPAKSFNVVFRVYDDGLAFRYDFPDQEPNIRFPSASRDGFLKSFNLTNELTGFVFPEDVTIHGLFTHSFLHSYEAPYNSIKVSDITRDSTLTLPALALYGGGPAVCFTEAALTDFSGLYLVGARDMENTLVSVLAPLPGQREIKVIGEVPFKTPWRVMMIADSPGKLIESDLVLRLNEPSRIDDVSWIKPGKASWDWWNGRIVDKQRGRVVQGGYNNETYKKYVDFSAQEKLEYFLVDAGWYGDHRDPDADITTGVEGVDIPELARYADSREVKLILWLNWECVKEQMETAFPLYQSWGVAGIKVDYMDRDDQEMVRFYHDVLAKAAEHRLMVNFHGAYKPTGIRRTWPNLITREAVLGLEYVKWSMMPDPGHNVTIPYTRMLVGPMDFTPGAINNATQRGFTPRDIDPMSMGTRCHQLAMFVVYESPLQVLADAPVNYDKAAGMDFMSMVPTTWDDTRFLQGEIGEYIVLARKKGDAWYLGAMTGWNAREITVSLGDILGGGNWRMKSWADGARADANPTEVSVSETQVGGSSPISIRMAPGGGFAAVLEPAR